jgi:hypothetical protein
VSTSAVKCNKGHSNRVSIREYIDHIKFAVYMAVSLITFSHIVLVYFLSLYVLLYACV